jgi:hypothetical protein
VTTTSLVLRQHQEADPELGLFFKALHTFADRTAAQFFSDTPDLPHPVVALEPDRKDRRGYYTAKDGYTLVHRINLNPVVLRDGREAAETLAHEMVHLWQAHVGRPMERNYHGAEFHARMRLYGIESSGKRGDHVGYIDHVWTNWLVANDDLQLHKFVLPGTGAEPKRKLIKHMCPDCGNNFRNRNELNVMCLDCTVPYELVDESETWDED